jgi:hypothetical protein
VLDDLVLDSLLVERALHLPAGIQIGVQEGPGAAVQLDRGHGRSLAAGRGAPDGAGAAGTSAPARSGLAGERCAAATSSYGAGAAGISAPGLSGLAGERSAAAICS